MITFEQVTKRYPDGTVAVDSLDLQVEAGEVVVLVGPSGCGKTTTMRMVNRMVDVTSGTITVDGEDITRVEPAALRRRIGYVIQSVGLFPHRTIADNVATVPRLLGWDRRRTADRVAELLEMIGLSGDISSRYPHQLSGGQRQRIGVARALAVDPPIMLMDEPFGAVDPLVRGGLQQEFLRLQAAVRKTIVFVTHDIDEAITMGDRIAIFAQGGVLQQYDTPDAILSAPANDFVVDFLGPERGLKRLSLIQAKDVTADAGPVVRADDDRSHAEAVAADSGTDWLVVIDGSGMLLGWVWLADVRSRVADATTRPFNIRVRATDTLRTALDAMVLSKTGVAVRVRATEEGDHYEGILTQAILTAELV